MLAILDKDRSSGKGGKGKNGKVKPLPKCAARQTSDSKRFCYAYNRGEKCTQSPCTFLHACWFCGGSHAGNEKTRPKK